MGPFDSMTTSWWWFAVQPGQRRPTGKRQQVNGCWRTTSSTWKSGASEWQNESYRERERKEACTCCLWAFWWAANRSDWMPSRCARKKPQKSDSNLCPIEDWNQLIRRQEDTFSPVWERETRAIGGTASARFVHNWRVGHFGGPERAAAAAARGDRTWPIRHQPRNQSQKANQVIK